MCKCMYMCMYMCKSLCMFGGQRGYIGCPALSLPAYFLETEPLTGARLAVNKPQSPPVSIHYRAGATGMHGHALFFRWVLGI